MKLLYANGDSWTHGDEISTDEIDSASVRYYNSWPWFLSNNLDISVCVNDAIGGGSNARIFRKANEFIFKWLGKKYDPKDLTVVIGWTTQERTEIGEGVGIYPIQIQGPLYLNDLPRDEKSLANYHKAFYETCSDRYMFLMTALYMVNLRLLCRSLRIKYYDFIAIGEQPQEYQKYINEQWGIELENMYMNGTWSAEAYEHNWSRYEFKHPTIETHKLWADILSKDIK